MDKGNILGNVVSNDERYKDVRENNIVEDSYDANLTKQVERTILRPKTAFFHISYVMDNLKDFQCQVSSDAFILFMVVCRFITLISFLST